MRNLPALATWLADLAGPSHDEVLDEPPLEVQGLAKCLPDWPLPAPRGSECRDFQFGHFEHKPYCDGHNNEFLGTCDYSRF